MLFTFLFCFFFFKFVNTKPLELLPVREGIVSRLYRLMMVSHNIGFVRQRSNLNAIITTAAQAFGNAPDNTHITASQLNRFDRRLYQLHNPQTTIVQTRIRPVSSINDNDNENESSAKRMRL